MLNLLHKIRASEPYLAPSEESTPSRLTAAARVITLPKLLAGLTVLAMGAVFVGYSFSRSQNNTDEASLAVLTPETSYTRIRPANPEGMAIPDQDKLVYRSVNPEAATKPQTDTVLPSPEQPLNNTIQTNKSSSETYTVLKPLSVTEDPALVTEPKPVPFTVEQKAEKKIEKKVEQFTQNPANAVATKKPAAPAIIKPIVTGSYRVQLVAARSEAQANTTWNTLRNRSNTLSTVKKFIEPVTTAKGTFYRLQVGSWTNRTDAVRVCQELKVKGIDCVVVQH